MKVHLHCRGGRPEVEFHVEDLERAERLRPRHEGVRGWVERKVAHYKTSWRESPRPSVQRLRQAWDWLHRRLPADEAFLAHLRRADALEIVYEPGLDTDEAAQLWQRYLKNRARRHGFWFAFNLLVAPLTLLLAPLPGPNLIGYWFAYRALHHGLILVGLKRAKARAIDATFHREGDASSAARAADDAECDAEPAACGSGRPPPPAAP